MDAGEDFHQSGFAGAVFADQGKHFRGADVQRYAVERLHAGEVLADIEDFEERSSRVHGVPLRLLAKQLVKLLTKVLDRDALLLSVNRLRILLAAVLGDDAEVDGIHAAGGDDATCPHAPGAAIILTDWKPNW